MGKIKDSNYQDYLKLLAIITMVIDHIGMFIFPEYTILRAIGRVAMPIFCFFAGYNFRDKPNVRIILVGLLLVLYSNFLLKIPLAPNILITIFLGQCYIHYFKRTLTRFFYIGYIHVVLLACLWLYTWALFDYGTLAISIMALGYIARHDKDHLNLAIFISFVITQLHVLVYQEVFLHFQIFISALLFVSYILMILRPFEMRVALNLRFIRANLLYIYAAQWSVLQLISYIKS